MKYLWRALGYLKHYWLPAAGAFLGLLISTAARLVVPRLTQIIIDDGIAAGRIDIIVWAAAGMVGVAIGGSLFTFLQGMLSARTAQGVAYDLRNQLYTKIQSLSFSYHDKAQTGQLLTRATSDVEMMHHFIGMGFIQFLTAILMMIGSITLLFVTDWQLALIMLVLVPLTFGVFGFFASKARPLFTKIQQRVAEINTVLQENLVGVRVVKAFAREPYEHARYTQANQNLFDLNLVVGRMFAAAMPLIFLIANLALLAVYWIGGYQAIAGDISVGRIVAFANYMMMAFFPMLMLGMIMAMISRAGASAERVFEILDAQSEVAEKPEAVKLASIQGRVAFERVNFRYFGGGELVLNDVSFTAEPGQTVALLGATGSGKSTIINLIPRFYDATEGRVTIDGHDVRGVTLDSLRQQTGIVLQETTLFSGTIRENIAFGRPEASLDEIITAAKAAEAHDFIASFPEGYDTPVGERGTTLSGGQKQRIAIARALLLDPRILILDDATSSVDYETEYRIQQALERLMKGRTSFVIAQRVATVLNADQILVLERGEIAARGTHEELLRESSIYAEIYYSQLEGERA
ncbi:MAG: ABC transporter ATP-binding protein [Chloroflexi bacterium]|nr:MAG: ABC transporter ATP-binding protein [Anaerolineaceae bacterium 4572_32.2]RLC79063.1 MAG: ABC transporter ATP-binding protein [Chloroflexota bacterium]RLC84780.1 MAG: ABC transporter ATP-binding protein [Chloroflexota bacterium]HEY72716.1 ABC transporter ATP-binding protein [Thermoflexia bacterium]